MINAKKLRLNVTYGLKLMVVMLALACCGYAHSPVKSAPPPTRDWTLYPAVVEVDTEQDFAAVSDPHGSYDRLSRVIQANGMGVDGGRHTHVDFPPGSQVTQRCRTHRRG